MFNFVSEYAKLIFTRQNHFQCPLHKKQTFVQDENLKKVIEMIARKKIIPDVEN